jgi:subtilisin family serine protease
MRAHPRSLFLFLFLFGIQPAVGKAQAAPKAISDVVVATDETTNQSTTYIADETTGTIYYRATTPGSTLTPIELTLADFKVFYRGRELSRPSALAYYKGKLVVVDKGWPAVFEIDTTTRSLNALLKGDALKDPNRVAVSQSGRLAVANGSGEIVLYDRYSKLTRVKRQFNSPLRLSYAGEDLLILEKTGRIQLVQAKSMDSGVPVVTEVELPERIATDIPKIVDFAFLNGTYYIVGENQIDAYVRSKGTVIPLFSHPMDSLSLAGISANKERIVLKDASRNSLWEMQRPVPVTGNFGKEATGSLISLYHYLLTQKLLPLRKFVTPQDYQSADELLIDQKIIFGETSPASSDAAKFVCELNESLCNPPGSTGTSPANQVIRKGSELYLPDLSYTEVIGYEARKLAGESVQSYLKRAFSSSATQLRFTEDFLWSLNELSKAETLELQLQTKLPGALLAEPPRASLAPGTIVRLGEEQDVIMASVPACGVQFKYGSKSYNLALHVKSSLVGSSAVAQLPRVKVSSALTKRLKQLGADRVELELDEPGVLEGDQKAISAAMTLINGAPAALSPTPDPSASPSASPASDIKTCLTQPMGPASYLVVDAVKVKSGRYRIYKQNSLLRLTAREIQSLGLLGKPDLTGEWTLLVNSPYYVAYRLSPWIDESVLQNPSTKPLLSARQLRPGGSQDIFGISHGEFLLPYVSQRQVTFLLTESELANDKSAFNQLKASGKFVALRAEENTRPYAITVPPGPTPAGAPPGITDVTRNRADLKREITFPDLPEPVEVFIGIGEELLNVDKKHADFIDQDCKSAWAREVGDPPPAPCTAPTPGVVRTVKLPSDFYDTDHGTHVAGLIGARNTSPVPGLIPSAKLFFIDTTSPDTTNTSITNAAARGVFIFNFSFGLKRDDGVLHENINTRWRNRLFVVAVDNDGSELRLKKNPLISFMDDVSENMIGVGSSIQAAGTEYVLGDWQSFRGVETGSSYGKKYVHLVAPGHAIYSTVSGNAYCETTGASQAAPQVSAAAGLLFAADITEPARIKARLIYTSDWFEQFRGKVWGGFLNVRRAVWEPKRNLIVTQGQENQTDAIILDDNDLSTMTIKRGVRYQLSNTGDSDITNEAVMFGKILRITALPDKSFRVIYLDANDHLKIVLNAEIVGILPCKSLQRLQNQVFAPTPCYPNGLDVAQLKDYVGRAPLSVTFAQ